MLPGGIISLDEAHMNTASEQCVVSKAALRDGSSSMLSSTAVAESSKSMSDADVVAVEAWETIKIAEDVSLAKSYAAEPTQSVQQPAEAPRASSCECCSGSRIATRFSRNHVYGFWS